MSQLLTPGEVAERFGVNAKTITRWCNAGMLPYQRTLGGHRRFKAADIEELLSEEEERDDD